MGEPLTKEAILNASDLEIESLDVPEWGGTIYIKPMTGAERDTFELSIKGEDGEMNMLNFRAKLAVRCICNAEGQRLFGDSDVQSLANKSASVLDRIAEIAISANKLKQEDIEELTKN